MTGRFAPLLITIGLSLGLTGCPEEVAPNPDGDPPRSIVYVSFPSGGQADLESGDRFAVSGDRVDLVIELGEPGTIYFTTDGSVPDRDAGTTGNVPDVAIISLDETTTVRWYGVDRVGNVEESKQVEIVFDREPPMLRIDPPPGEYSGQVQVAVEANEPATLYWTVDGTAPQPGAPTTSTAGLPALIDLVLPTELRLLAIDDAGNQGLVGPLDYVIDAQAPTTVADPGPGLYLAPVEVSLTTDDPEAAIYFTVDGSEPDRNSTRYAGPIAIDSTLDLRVRSYDPGGNAEQPQTLPYRIGARGPRAPAAGDQPELFPTAGGLRMGAALIDVAGALSGRPGAASTGADWTTWSLGRTAIDATLLQSGVGPHGMNSPGLIDLSAAGEGVPDRNVDGSNLDDTFFARVDALAEQVGESRVPDGLHPPSVPIATGDARLVAPVPAARAIDGRPQWEDDYRQLRWTGIGAAQRLSGVDVVAAGLRATLVRARSALAVQHPVGEGAYARQVAPVVGLRCVACHGAGVEPRIDGAAELQALGLIDGDEPPLLDLLSGRTPHPVDPATPEEVDAVADWIAAGAAAQADADRRVGPDAREGLLGLLAIEHAAQMLAHTAASMTFDVEANRLQQFAPGADQYVIGEAEIVLGAGAGGTEQVTQVRVVDRTFDTAAQARLLRALARWIEFGAARPELFVDGPLAGSAVFPSAPAQAQALAETLAAGMVTRVGGTEDAPVASWNPGSGPARQVEALALAEYAMALRATGRALEDETAVSAANDAVAFLVSELRRPDGDYADAWRDGEIVPGARRAEVQWAVLEALLDAAADGDSAAREAAEALWGRLEAMWFDPRAGVWQTVIGLETWLYDPQEVSRTLDGLRAAVEADLPDAGSRLSTALDRLVIPFVWADTWLSGEITAGDDVDGDGLPKPGDVGATGIAPVFRQSMSL